MESSRLATTGSCVLDTHIWIWLLADQARLSRKTIVWLEEAAQQCPLLVPSICVWELAMLEKDSRVELPEPIDEWVKKSLSDWRIRKVDLTPEIMLESVHLPGRFHADPADRMIVATASLFKLPVVTNDKKILAYGKSGHVSVVRG